MHLKSLVHLSCHAELGTGAALSNDTTTGPGTAGRGFEAAGSGKESLAFALHPATAAAEHPPISWVSQNGGATGARLRRPPGEGCF